MVIYRGTSASGGLLAALAQLVLGVCVFALAVIGAALASPWLLWRAFRELRAGWLDSGRVPSGVAVVPRSRAPRGHYVTSFGRTRRVPDRTPPARARRPPEGPEVAPGQLTLPEGP